MSGVYATVNDIAVKRWELNTNYGVAVARMTFTHPYSSGFDVGTEVVGKIGTAKMFTGRIKSIIRRRPENIYEFMAQDRLTYAVEYWFVPESIDKPSFSRSNIDHLTLTRQILNEASIGDEYIQDDWSPYPTFQFATGPEPLKINIASAWDVVSWICTITGMHVYADADGIIHLSRIADEPSGDPTNAFTTGNLGNMKTVEWVRSDENLRNSVHVFGRSGVHKKAQASSPYVPVGFYKTVVISYEMIDNDEMAQETADINLARLNKLTESCVVEAIGNVGVLARQTVSITDPLAGISGNWFLTQIAHRVDAQGGYTVRLTAKK